MSGAFANDPLLALQNRAFVFGREYFVLRSGRVQMVVQADKVDLGPAVRYMLFDAREPSQSARKDRALNYDPVDGLTSTALVVELGGHRFTALGHRTTTRWTTVNNIPAVEAQWWAGGIRVTEAFLPSNDSGRFIRSIRLEGAHLVREESVNLRLQAFPGECVLTDSAIKCVKGPVSFSLDSVEGTRTTADQDNKLLVLGPVAVGPKREVLIRCELEVQFSGDAETAAGDTASTAPSILSKWTAASRISAGDPLVTEVFNKARYGLDGMIADNGAMNAGIFEYGAQWVRDSSNTIIGAIHAGHFELARAGLDRVLSTMITTAGATMIGGGFDAPDLEQFDQMGELMHVMKAYRDWTGDESLLVQYRDRLLAMIERPLHPSFRAENGMVHNKREFWERTLTDGYELAYQMWVVQGLRDAAALAPVLGAQEHAERWRREADKTLNAMLSHQELRLVVDNHLIKRRKVTGEPADETTDIQRLRHDAPSATETWHRLRPDSTEAMPIALGIVDPGSSLARNTLDQLEQLWNTRWHDGGYDRYNTTSQPDQPGPWPFATCFIMRAQHEAGLLDRSRRSLDWLNNVQGGRSGGWFEEIPSNHSMGEHCGVLPWTSGEISLFVVRHVLGVRFDGANLIIKPKLFPGSGPVDADLRFRDGRLRLKISGHGKIKSAQLNGAAQSLDSNGAFRLRDSFSSGTIELTMIE